MIAGLRRYPDPSEHIFGSASLPLLTGAAKQLNVRSECSTAPCELEDCGLFHVPWYVTVLACKRVADRLGRFPGALTTSSLRAKAESTKEPTADEMRQRNKKLQSDIDAVKAEVRDLEKTIGLDLFVTDDIIKQVVLYRGSEFPATTALIGGVAAQETIKLLCKQFDPINNTFLWNGTERRGLTLQL